MRKDRRGLAALFDAMIFLAIAAIVSMAMMSAFTPSQAAGGAEELDLESIHRAVLRSTMTTPSGNSYELGEAVIIGVASEDITSYMRDALRLLLPGWEWRWSAEAGGEPIVIGSPDVPGGTDIYCSMVRVPLERGEAVYSLEVWRA